MCRIRNFVKCRARGFQIWISSSRLPTTALTMDFSQLNPAEQAHMSKVIEKKQVNSLSGRVSAGFERTSGRRCRIFFECTPDWLSAASIPVAMTSLAKPCHQKRHGSTPYSPWSSQLIRLVGTMCHELHRKVYQTFRTYRSAFCGTERWCVKPRTHRSRFISHFRGRGDECCAEFMMRCSSTASTSGSLC